MKGKIIGSGILAIAFFIAIFYTVQINNEPIIINGYIGGEKIGFIEDSEVKSILKNKYHLIVEYKKAGSLDMAELDVSKMDYVFPSSSIAADVYKESNSYLKTEDVFMSPIVIYSWDEVVDVLMKQGIVREENGVFIVDMIKLVDIVEKNTTWEDIGASTLFGQICVFTTDPVRSNSGNLFAALIANVLNNNQVVSDADLPKIEDKLISFLNKSGYKETSSQDLFTQYIRTSVGGKPLVALYENQIIEFANQNPDDWNKVKDSVRILYPEPTLWSSHQLISLNENGNKLLEALNDERIKEIAKEEYGFRLDATTEMDVSETNLSILQNITKIMQLPNYSTMKNIINKLK